MAPPHRQLKNAYIEFSPWPTPVSYTHLITGPNLAKRMVEIFLNTEFEGGRHARRVGLVDAIKP